MILNSLLILVMLLAIYMLYNHYAEITFRKSLLLVNKKDEKDTLKVISNFKYLAENFLLKTFLRKYVEVVELVYIILNLLILIIFFMSMQFIIGILVLSAINIGAYKFLLTQEDYKLDILVSQLPQTIDSILKNMTSKSDIASILYNTSLDVMEPMRAELQQLSRVVLSQDAVITFKNYSDKMKDVWINVFMTALISYVSDSKKQDVISILIKLRAYVMDEEERKASRITDSKTNVVLNYILLGVASFAFIGQLIFNPIAYNFFVKSPLGSLLVLVGIISAFITVFINLKLSSNKRKRI